MKKRSKLLKGLRKVFNINQVTQVEVDVTEKSYRSISDKELKNFLISSHVQDNSGRRIVDKLQLPAMLEPVGRELLDRRMDNEKLTSIAPEIAQAASILIPSILAPNDFRKNVFDVIIEGGNESDLVKNEIIKLLKHHFDTELEMSTKLSIWVQEAMFNAGCKAIMILPTTTIGKLRDGIGSTESLGSMSSTLLKEFDMSLESINVRDVKKRIYSDDDITDRAFATGAFDEIITTSKDRDLEQKKVKQHLKRGITEAFSNDRFTKLIKFTNDPRILLKSKINNGAALEAIDSKILATLGEAPKPIRRDPKRGMPKGKIDFTAAAYNHLPYIDLSEYVHDDKACDYPAIMELPGEAVIPVIIDGSPQNHIGYFVMLNENGSPISIDNQEFGDMLTSSSGSERINNLYNAFYGSGQFSLQKKMAADAKVEILNSIYDSFIRNMIDTRLDSMGLEKHRVELTSSVSRVMFSRLLKNAETRILFVPKKLMVYMAFQYNSDGTGRSKIDNIKFPLSLKMTLIIVRLISLIESSINRRNINVTLDDNIGNPIELLRSLKKDLVNNKLYGLSYDPSTIIKSVLDKEITIIPNHIPGVEDFSISDTPNNVEYPKPDDAILDEIKNMYMLSLGVPPSAMNRLSEDEFSRSVASNNIFFSNQLRTEQRVVKTVMTELIATYIGFSKKLKDGITDILNKEATESLDDKAAIEETTETDPALEAADTKVKITGSNDDNDDGDDPELSIDTRLKNIIDNIKFTLPSPNLAQDKSSFDELNEYITMIDTVINNLFPDDMIADPDTMNFVKVLRASVKRDILQTHIKDNSLLSDLNFDALANVDVVGSVETTQKIMNFKAALEATIKNFKSADAEGGTPSW